MFGENVEGQAPEQIADRLIVSQADANQLKRYWSTNQNGPHDVIGHIFDQYGQTKNSGDRLAAARYLDSKWQELLDMGYKPTYPRPNVAALEARQNGTGSGPSTQFPGGGQTGNSDAQTKESAFWTQYFGLKD